MRYDRILDLVREHKPSTILEVGTWNGGRAALMLAIVPKARYYGFDLFEDATAETDKEEFNVKAHNYMEIVAKRLNRWDVHLFKGNTRETLKEFKPDRKIDFVWLDGGHSIKTIRSDWENIKPHLSDNAVVLFDDYFTGPIDTSVVGCNEIVNDLKHELFKDKDAVMGGGFTQIARVWP